MAKVFQLEVPLEKMLGGRTGHTPGEMMLKTVSVLLGMVLVVGVIFPDGVQAQGALAGDANGDCRVDGIDFVILLNHYGQTVSEGVTVGDFNGDGRVDGVDYVILLNHYGQVCQDTPVPTATRTPTPTTSGSTPTITIGPSPTPSGAGAIIVDHDSVALFDQIPDQYLTAARNLRTVFIDRSVGNNINTGLDCLGSVSPGSVCTREHMGWPHEAVNDPVKYNRSNWQYYFFPVQAPPYITCSTGAGSWPAMGSCFDEWARANIASYDVLSYQHSYLEVLNLPGNNIADLQTGYFVDQPSKFDVYDYQRFETDNPFKHVIYWTTSLARAIGTPQSESFNNQMRQFATNRNKILFDFADIVSHDPKGNPCYDNRDGVEYCQGTNCENYPDDSLNILAICPAYTPEVNAGHLGTGAAVNRVAKAYWVLMAQIAGWRSGQQSSL